MTISIKHVFLLFLSLLAFAANSVLCRLALSSNDSGALISPIGFTFWRLISGAIMLMLLCWFLPVKSHDGRKEEPRFNMVWQAGSWPSAMALLIYAVGFSFAYVSLSTGGGALILFGAVQLTLIGLSLRFGHRLAYQEWVGLVIAFAGFVYLVLPTLTSPSVLGFVLMSFAGVAWGMYTWRGKSVRFSLYATASNFIRTLPIVLILWLVLGQEDPITQEGWWLAVLSGAIMSGIGYALWYRVLPHIHSAQAAVLQLLVPIIAAVGGVLFSEESITGHLLLASLGVLGGVFLMVHAKRAK